MTSRQDSRHGVDVATARPGLFRPDIQGLRAFAVLAVVGNHLTRRVSGGFVGVDVFFVISGFLITALLVRETERSGRLSFRGFYLRRARRILPAALATLLACVVAAHLVFLGTRVRQTVTDVWWALGFSANIHFSRIGTDYFQQTRPPSLVQHFWSLAVEEQFYLMWPVVVLLVLTVLGRRLNRSQAKTVLLVVVAAGCVASFVWAVHQTQTVPAQAYFDTFSRAWELGTGAVISVVLARRPDLPQRLGRLAGPLTLLGLIAIVVSVFTVPETPGFPAPAALTPVAGAALVLLAGATSTRRWNWPLVNPAASYVGLVSYSLYLWHWPTIIICEALVPRSAGVFWPMTVLAIVVLTVASFHLVESPFHHGASRVPVIPSRIRRPGRRQVMGAVAVLAAAVSVVGLYIARPAPAVPHFGVGAPKVDAPAPNDTPPAVTAAVQHALAATTFPHLQPAFDDPTLTGELNRQNHLCINPPSVNDTTTCTRGAAGSDKRAFVVGDSVSTSWLPGVDKALLPLGYVVHGTAFSSCPFNDAPTSSKTEPEVAASCNRGHAAVRRQIEAFKPSLLVISDQYTEIGLLADHPGESMAHDEWAAALARTIRSISRPGLRVVVLAPPPPGGNALTCAVGGAVPAACVTRIPQQWLDKRAADRDGARMAGATYVDTSTWFCSDTGYCPIFAAGTPVRSDPFHISNAYCRFLTTALRAVLIG